MERHGLRRPSSTVASQTVGRLSPMAFLVGVAAGARAAGHFHPMRPATWTAVESFARAAIAVQAADASPSPLQGEAPLAA